jgi:hypothetical protein
LFIKKTLPYLIYCQTIWFDSEGKIIHVATKRLSTTDAFISEAEAVLFASQISSSLGIYSLVLEGDAIYIYIYLAIQQPILFK